MANQGGSVISLDVFISFSRQDVGAADGICQALEATGIRCWIAHRDIAPGRGYLGPVLEAVDHCRAVLLIASSHTTTSNAYVLYRAAGRGVPIIWLKIDHATPSAEFKRFRESAVVIDASVPPLESHFRSLAACVKSLLNPTPTEDRHEISSGRAEGSQIFEPGSAGYSPDESALLHGGAAPLEVGLPSDAIEDGAIESALRMAAAVLSEIRAQDSIASPDASARARGVPPLAARPTPPKSRQKHTKRNFALVVAGLAVLAFGTGALFSEQITDLLRAINEFLRHLGVGAGEPSATAPLAPAASVLAQTPPPTQLVLRSQRATSDRV